MSRSPHLLRAALAAALLFTACGERSHVVGEGTPDGATGDGGAPDHPDSGPSTDAPAAAPDAAEAGAPAGPTSAGVMPPVAPGQRMLRRLTIGEYSRTIRDLIGSAPPALLLGRLAPDQGTSDDFLFVTGARVADASDVSALLDIAEQMASTAVGNLSTLLPPSCLPLSTKSDELDQCARAFIIAFGARAYREPLTDQAVTDLFALYQTRRGPTGAGAFADALRVVITAMLLSHNFLFHWELAVAPRHDITSTGDDDKFAPFTPYEMASRLSYFFWGSMPDSALFAAAAANQLSTPDQLAAQAQRMLADPRAADGLGDFYRQWLQTAWLLSVPKDPVNYPSYTPDLAQALYDETGAFVNHVMMGPSADGKLATLLTDPRSVIGPTLAAYYGVAPGIGPDPTLVALNPTQRAGIFTQGAFLAANADADGPNPVRRGDAVLRSLLCEDPQIPVGVTIPPLPEVKPNQSNREHFQAGTADSYCQECHARINGFGFAFEGYDGTGAFRATDQGKPVDASGTVGLRAGPISFTSAVDLMPQIAEAPEVRQCQATQWLGWLLRRRPAGPEPTWLSDPLSTFDSSGGDLRQLLMALVRTPPFTTRARITEEVGP